MAAGGLRAAVWTRVLPAGRSPGPHARGCPSHSLSWGTTSVAPGARPCLRPMSAPRVRPRSLGVVRSAFRLRFYFSRLFHSNDVRHGHDREPGRRVRTPSLFGRGRDLAKCRSISVSGTSVCWDVKPLLGRLAGVADSLVPSTRPRGRRGRQNIISREPRTLAACWAGPCGTLSPPRRGRRYISRVLRSQRTGLRVRPVKSFPTPLKRLIGTKT